VESIGDDDIVTHGLDVKRNEVGGRKRSVKALLFIAVVVVVVVLAAVAVVLIVFVRVERYGVKVAVVDVDAAVVEVGCIEVAVTLNEGTGETGEAGPVCRF
jgi:flagellar basal body-associated protein FliL